MDGVQEAFGLARRIVMAEGPEVYRISRLFYDHGLADCFFLGYAYFRWADDRVDNPTISAQECRSFLRRQRHLLEQLCRGETPVDLCPQEQMLAQLVAYDLAYGSEMRPGISLMLQCLAFDGERRHQVLDREQLDWYSEALGRSYTDSQQYFIGHGHPYPRGPERCVAGATAHRVHVLRDFLLDLSMGYINIPSEEIEAYEVDLANVNDAHFREWVRDRVQAAREGFCVGKAYLNRLDVLRCKLVGYIYCLRYELVLDSIEKDSHHLRESYALGRWGRLRFLGRGLWTCLWVTVQHVLRRLVGPVATLSGKVRDTRCEPG